MSRPAPETRSDYQVFYAMPTRWQDNDQYGHMNNVIHYALFDTAISNWQMERGLFDDTAYKMVVVESGCTYFAEAGYPDLIHAGLRISHIGGSSWRYDIGLFRNDETTTFAKGFFAQVLVDAATMTPTRIPDEMRGMLAPLLGKA